MNLSNRGFRLYYNITRNPLGIAAEKVPSIGAAARKSMKKFVEQLAEGLGFPLSVGEEGTYVLLDIDTKKGSIVFKVEATVKNGSRKKLTEEMIRNLEKSVFSRYGYLVEFM